MPIYRFDGVVNPAENDQLIETEDINGFRRLVSIGGLIELSTSQVNVLRQRFLMPLSTEPAPNANRKLAPVDQQYLEQRIENLNAEYDKTIDRQHGDVDHVAAADPHYDRAYARSLILTEAPRKVGTANQPSFNADFVNAGGGTQDLFFYLDASGIVHIEGTIKSPAGQAAGVPIFKLPSPLLNLLSAADSSFESGTGLWLQSNGVMGQSSSWAGTGTKSLGLTASASSGVSGRVVAGAVLGYAGGMPVPVIGEQYSASCKVNKIDSIARGIRVALIIVGGASNGQFAAVNIPELSSVGVSNIVANSYQVIPVGATGLLLSIAEIADVTNAPASEFYIDEVQVVKAATPPPYQILAQHLPSGKVRGGSASTGSGNSVQLEVATNGDVSMTAAAVANAVYGINMHFRGV